MSSFVTLFLKFYFLEKYSSPPDYMKIKKIMILLKQFHF
ncbi:hypothetical protein EMIT036CA2_30612 [Chryseobacterium sp. IT-36CA2]